MLGFHNRHAGHRWLAANFGSPGFEIVQRHGAQQWRNIDVQRHGHSSTGGKDGASKANDRLLSRQWRLGVCSPLG
jgi:hypothetical protein